MTIPDKPSYQQRTAYHVTLLGTVAFICSAALVIADLQTREQILAERERRLAEQLVAVLPIDDLSAVPIEPTVEIEDASGSLTAWQLLVDGRVEAVAFERVGPGYGGDIRVLVGIAHDGTVVAARVTEHRETPGLGDGIEARRSDWIDSFDGRSLGDPPAEEWAVRKDGGVFDQFTGATVTPRGVVSAVRDALHLFQRHRERLLDPAASAASRHPPPKESPSEEGRDDD